MWSQLEQNLSEKDLNSGQWFLEFVIFMTIYIYVYIYGIYNTYPSHKQIPLKVVWKMRAVWSVSVTWLFSAIVRIGCFNSVSRSCTARLIWFQVLECFIHQFGWWSHLPTINGRAFESLQLKSPTGLHINMDIDKCVYILHTVCYEGLKSIRKCTMQYVNNHPSWDRFGVFFLPRAVQLVKSQGQKRSVGDVDVGPIKGSGLSLVGQFRV